MRPIYSKASPKPKRKASGSAMTYTTGPSECVLFGSGVMLPNALRKKVSKSKPTTHTDLASYPGRVCMQRERFADKCRRKDICM